MTQGTLPVTFTRDESRLAGAAGLLAVAGNVFGVLALHDMPSAYRLARLDEWAAAVPLAPAATVASALGFSVGLVALAAWAREFGKSARTPLARVGARFVSDTSLVNAFGSLLPVVLALHVGGGALPVGRALLGVSLTLDALFNLGLGAGLVLIAARAPRGFDRTLALLAGLASIPVAGQAVWDPAAKLLYVAAPLWLALITKTSLAWLTRHAAR